MNASHLVEGAFLVPIIKLQASRPIAPRMQSSTDYFVVESVPGITAFVSALVLEAELVPVPVVELVPPTLSSAWLHPRSTKDVVRSIISFFITIESLS
jgi:hypothetical protein